MQVVKMLLQLNFVASGSPGDHACKMVPENCREGPEKVSQMWLAHLPRIRDHSRESDST